MEKSEREREREKEIDRERERERERETMGDGDRDRDRDRESFRKPPKKTETNSRPNLHKLFKKKMAIFPRNK